MFVEDKIKELISSKQTIININTEKDEECLIHLLNVAEELDIELYEYSPFPFIGLQSVEYTDRKIKKESTLVSSDFGEDLINSIESLYNYIEEHKGDLIIVFNDYQFLNNPLYDKLLKIFASRRNSEKKCTFILQSNNYQVAKELDPFTYVIDLDYPSEENIKDFLESYCKKNNIDCFSDKDSLDIAVKRFNGLDYPSMLKILDKSIKRYGFVNLDILEEEKLQEIKKTSVLDIKFPNKTLDDVGGYSEFKKYIEEINLCRTKEAEELGLSPKGYLALGVPGAAKTFIAESLAASWNVPFIKLELNKILSKFAGESEKNMSKALELIKSCAPCVCLIDEVEKVLGGKQTNRN